MIKKPYILLIHINSSGQENEEINRGATSLNRIKKETFFQYSRTATCVFEVLHKPKLRDRNL
ncbi:MAG TPA: hypothetical protein DCQ26_16695 [Marinilabiliales bacterium]|jgi:hypothetical protein|nr:MAG: hypothetical protein A2W95_01650 [Bacteroidetes bacterium GWA2_40_14]OFX59309.1 MAG: hypothetical protein A2W84_02355 [Bacteroidetes bacterium GWC2_40_13]OFX74720.1 MAG: hypothetical protein A2W96_04445 [Bacteroidetes bacterium GWD2_40_43]OFX88454.1 MAG: hypothetical protein A2W97_09540 [Bacteroidetes bacterium GWE2_40_63]OFY22612.1 MAG: hypothetical protein A2W88_11285 [Bacteroidetes bacterium GWF2_40_13]OFZ29574.1 MAG: hypothetical protein A2437_08725 [Bacteroidetes bacterium RIFOXYC